ncbi:Mss4-like protein [Podospora conica]|nr:Mss4-like protein [Schizothecium conicum]
MADADHKSPRHPSQDKRSDGTEPHQHQAGSSTTRDEDQWKFRPPYRLADDDDTAPFDVKWRAKCHCGAVRYELSRARPLAAKYCHCTTCQRLHGAPFQWAAIFHKEDVRFTQGHHDLGWYDAGAKSQAHKLPCKVQCAYCRTPIMDEGRNMVLLFPTLVEGINTGEGREAFKAGCHMFYKQRVVDVRDGLPKWAGMNDDSELVDEETGEVIEGKEEEGGDKKRKKREGE